MNDVTLRATDPNRWVRGRVSVVIPAYNAASTVAAAIESCLAQDHPDVEVIVVDDGSTDRTGEVLAGFGNRITVVSQPNAGLAAARNAGQRVATGEYLAWMDADDVSVRGRLRVQASVLAAHANLGLVSSDFSAFHHPDSDFDAAHWRRYYSAVDLLGGPGELYPEVLDPVPIDHRTVAVRAGRVQARLLWGNFVHPPTVMHRRHILEEVGESDETLRYSSDYELILRLARRTPFAFIDAPLLRYRRSPTQMSYVHAGDAMQLETVRILDRIRHDEPQLADREAAVIRRRTAESLVTAADHVATTDRMRALRLLLQAARHRLLLGASSVALGRIVIPPALVPHLKHAARAIFRLALLATTGVCGDALDLVGLGTSA